MSLTAPTVLPIERATSLMGISSTKRIMTTSCCSGVKPEIAE